MKHNLDNIPIELKKLPQWVIWKADKKPRNPRNNQPASVSDPRTWDSFENACKAAKQYRAGVGFVFTENDDYCGVDLDKVIDEKGVMNPEDQAIIDKLDSYTEVSQSGRGIHIIVKGSKPDGACKGKSVEVYDRGRYFALTGGLWQDRRTINERQDGLDWLFQEKFGGEKQKAEPETHPIYEGKGRNNAVTREAGRLLTIYKDPSVAKVMVQAYNQEVCVPPLDEKECASTWEKSLMRWRVEADAPDKDTHLSDAGNAQYMAKLYGDILRHDHKRKRWLYWGNHHWVSDEDGYVGRLAEEAAKLRFLKSVDIKDTKFREKAANWAIASESKMKIDACISIARNKIPFTDKGHNWDTDTMLLGCENGIIDLRTGELRPGKPEDRITMTTGLDYDPNASCPRWTKFLREIFADKEGKPDEELIDWLWRVLGLSITGDMSEQIFMEGWGGGANGKSEFRRAIHNALGDYAYSTPFSTFSLPPPSSFNDLAALEHKRFVTSSETNIGIRLNIERIKAISGGDEINARYLYQEFEIYQPHLKLWLFVNHKPDIDDDTIATWRRVRLIQFTKTFIKEADDKHLKEKLKAEAQGILAWLVRGCLQWQSRGLAPVPKSVRVDTGEYRRETDPMIGFMSDRCEREEGVVVGASRLYSAYRGFARDEGRMLTQTAFGKRLTSMGIIRDKDSRGNKVYKGIKLKEEGSWIHVNMTEEA